MVVPNSVFQLLGVLESIATASAGAFLAYLFWTWLDSPHLVVADVSRIPVVDPDGGDEQQSVRVEVQNIGSKSAENCEAILDFRTKTDESVIRGIINASWISKKERLLVADEENRKRVNIPAGRLKTIELTRQYRAKQIQISPVDPGSRFVEVESNSEFSIPVNEKPEIAFKDSRIETPPEEIQTYSSIRDDSLEKINWESATIELHVETESALPLIVEFNTSVDDEGWIQVTPNPLGWRKRVSNKIYRILNKLRTDRWPTPYR